MTSLKSIIGTCINFHFELIQIQIVDFDKKIKKGKIAADDKILSIEF